MKASKPKSFDPVPAGSHVARLYQIIYIGTIPTTWKGQEKLSNKVRLGFELCNERKVFKEGEPERPYSISREFTFSMGAKGNLRPFVEGMRGVKMHDDEAYNLDFDEILGDACLLTVVHEEKEGNIYSNIMNSSPLPKGMEAPVIYNETQIIDVSTSSREDIEKLPDFIKNKLYSSEEWANRLSMKSVDKDFDAMGDASTEASAKNYRPNSVNHAEGEAEDVPTIN